MTTFSQMVDKMVLETRRPDLTTEIASYVNQTLRELHMEPGNGNAIFYRDNMQETQITATSDQGFSWPIPKTSTFQAMLAVRYDSLAYRNTGWDISDFANPGQQPYNPEPVYARQMSPGRAMNKVDWYYYRSGLSIYFYGYGGTNALISLAWFEFVPYLTYYLLANRPAQYDEVSGWTYSDVYNGSAELNAQAQLLCSNWILLRWPTVVEEGVRAKVYKRLSDDSRAKTSYSMYTTLRQGLFTSETADVSGSWSG